MPNNWKTYKLGELISYQKGFAFKSDWYKEKGELIVRISDTTSNSIDISSCHRVDKDKALELQRYKLEKDDIVIATVGSWPPNYASVVGKVIKVPSEANGALLNQNAVRLKSIDETLHSKKYIYYLMKSEYFLRYIVNTAQGSASQASIKLTDIFDFKFNIPSIKEQQAIASILSAIDDKIENNLAINKSLEEMAMTLYKHWFVDFGPFQEGEFVESEFGMIPQGWEVKSLENIGDFKNGKGINASKRSEDGKYIILGSNGIIGRTNEIMFKEPVIAIGRVGANYGEVHFSIEPCWISDNAITVQPQIKNHYWFIYQILKEVDYSNFATGSAQPLITQSSVKALKFSCPDLESLDLYSSKIEMLYNKRNKNLTENQSLTQVRDTLLPQLISGTVRLKEFRETIEEVV